MGTPRLQLLCWKSPSMATSGQSSSLLLEEGCSANIAVRLQWATGDEGTKKQREGTFLHPPSPPSLFSCLKSVEPTPV